MKFLKWLLHAGRPNRQAVGQAGHANVADTVWAQTNEIGLVQRDIRYTANGVGETHRIYWINPDFKLAMENYFYSPDAA